MGNVLGLSTATEDGKLPFVELVDEIIPFDNLSMRDVENLWSSFYEVANGYAVTKSELENILILISKRLGVSPTEIVLYASDIFNLYSFKSSSVMDMMEFLMSVVFLAAIPVEDKLHLIFDCFDMSDDENIDIDEFTISLKSVLCGLCKINKNSETPVILDELQCEDLAEEMYRSIAGLGSTEKLLSNSSISGKQFIDYCMNTKSVLDIVLIFGNAEGAKEINSDIEDEGIVPERSKQQIASMDPEEIDLLSDIDKNGDEFLAVKPWIGAIVAPTKDIKLDPSAPSSQLTLEWVYGYRSQDMRNSVRYIKSGEIIYTAAAVGIVLNPSKMEQRHQLSHTDDIISFALHPGEEIAATGEIGKTPKIIVWNVMNMESLCTIRGYHTRGILSLDFSRDGNKLLSIGADDDHTIAIYMTTDDWKSQKLWVSMKGCKDKVLDSQFNPDGSSLVVCGVKTIQFWTSLGEKPSCKKGILGKKGTIQAFLCIGWIKTSTIIGTADGNLYQFEGNNLMQTIKAHEKSVHVLYSYKKGIISGSKDGSVIVWNEALQKIIGPYSLSIAQSRNISIKSVCLSGNEKIILIGTHTSEIMEMKMENGELLNDGNIMSAHYNGEVWGLAVHPTTQQACTVGDDKTLRIWDLGSKKIIKLLYLDAPARACAYSSDGKLIAVGFGNGNDKKDGAVLILTENKLEKVKEIHDSKRWISEIKFSPNGKLLAVGGHDNKIIYYDVLANFTKKRVFSKHSSYIRHMDFSKDSQYLQSNCGAYELLFNETATGKQNTSPSSLRDTEWASWTCILGYPVQGIYPPCSDGTDINAVCCSFNKETLATVDDFGKVKLFRYPCVDKKSQYTEYRGHSSHVSNVRWSMKDEYLLTTGGNDRCLFQWKHESFQSDKRIRDQDEDYNVISSSLIHERDSSNLLDQYAGGDEFLAVKPWLGAIVAPSKPPKENTSAPEVDIQLEWVHGYQARNSRDNVRYSCDGDIVYHAAALGIVYDNKKHLQRFNMDHDDDIVALAMHPKGTYAATGQMGKKPQIQIWDCSMKSSLKSISSIRGFHTRAVILLCFTEDGEKLGSMGDDDDHSIAIYKWREGTILASCKGDKDKVLSLCFNPTNGEWISCGVKHVKFWKVQGRNISGKKGILSKKGEIQNFYSLVIFNAKPIAATHNGELYVFNGNELSVVKKVSEGNSVTSLYAKGDYLVSGSRNGEIIIWNKALEKQSSFILTNKISDKVIDSCIRSVCLSNDNCKILVGTQGSDIFEFDTTSMIGKTITHGHGMDEVWGLAIHPLKKEYCTVGDDKTLRIFDISLKKQIHLLKLDTMARTCAYSPNGKHIAVGLGGRVGKGKQLKDGGILLIDEANQKIIFEDRPSKKWISQVKFSPNGKYVAFGSHDNVIYIYEVISNSANTVLKLKSNFKKHNSYITHFDFAINGEVMQSNCGAYELLFSNPMNGQQITSASSLRDASWSTWTCPLGWPVQGIWPPCADGTDINAVDRSKDGALLATADDFGKVKIFRYPCIQTKNSSLELNGHSSHVTNVRWGLNDEVLISTGGNDRCVMQWSMNKISSEESFHPPNELYPEDDLSVTLNDLNERDRNFNEDSHGDEFMAIKPWLGAIVAPSNPPFENSRPPDVHLELDWVYGYQSQLSRNNVMYNKNDDIVYHTAAVCIVYNVTLHRQKYHMGHTDDILCLAISKDRNYIATGERGKKPSIRIWDSDSCQLTAELKGFHSRGVLALSFCQDSSKLCSIGDDDDHSIALWQGAGGGWNNVKLICTSKGDKNPTIFCHYLDNTAEFQVISGGSKHVRFWTISGTTLKSKIGQFGKTGKIQPILCCAYFNGKIITGTSDGNLYQWSGNTLSKIVFAHEKGVGAICSTETGLFTGGKDGKLGCFDKTLQLIFKVDINRGSIRSICLNHDESKMVIGTETSEIFELNATNGSHLHNEPLVQGHCRDELWGLAVHPFNDNVFCTSGDDKSLRLWDIEAKKMTKLLPLSCMSRTCAFSNDGKNIAVGLGGSVGRGKQQKDGAILILTENLSIIYEEQLSKRWISEVKYSPNGSTLAFGAHDGTIYMYDTSQGSIKKKNSFKKHNSYITHFDFSNDGNALQSNCGAYELLFSNPLTGQQITSASSMKDVKWDTWTCTLGWPVQGIWPPCSDGTDINAVCVTKKRELIATADDFGKVKLFRYPCLTKGAKFVEANGHSSHVTNVRFTNDDRYCISLGGNDRSIFQWKLSVNN